MNVSFVKKTINACQLTYSVIVLASFTDCLSVMMATADLILRLASRRGTSLSPRFQQRTFVAANTGKR
jgi:hypothetical protein